MNYEEIIDHLVAEKMDYKEYKELAEKMEREEYKNMFMKIAEDECNHYKMIRELLEQNIK